MKSLLVAACAALVLIFSTTAGYTSVMAQEAVTVDQLEDWIAFYAAYYGADYTRMRRIAICESNFGGTYPIPYPRDNPYSGAQGVFQFIPNGNGIWGSTDYWRFYRLTPHQVGVRAQVEEAAKFMAQGLWSHWQCR